MTCSNLLSRNLKRRMLYGVFIKHFKLQKQFRKQVLSFRICGRSYVYNRFNVTWPLYPNIWHLLVHVYFQYFVIKRQSYILACMLTRNQAQYQKGPVQRGPHWNQRKLYCVKVGWDLKGLAVRVFNEVIMIFIIMSHY